MSSTVGKAKIVFEADTSKLSEQLLSKLQEALGKIDPSFAKITQKARKTGKDSGDALGEGVKKGAEKADKAVSSVGEGGMPAVDKAAQKAAEKVEDSVTKAAGKASEAIGDVGKKGMPGVDEAARKAGESVAKEVGKGAEKANESLGRVNGKGLGRIGDAARNAGRSIREALKKPLEETESTASKIPGVIGRIGVAAAAVAGPAAVLKGGFDRLMKIQRAEIMFKSIGLSAQETKDQMARLSEQVTGTSVSLADAAKYSAMFAQSGVEMGKPMDDAIQAFTSLASIAEGSGVDVGRVLQQISAQGKLSGEDLNQMADAGVNATKYLADSLGLSQEEVKKAVSDGKVSFEDFITAVNAGTGDLAKQMGQTLPAKISNFKTALTNLGATIIEPFIPGITAAVEFGITITKGVIAPIKVVIAWFQQGSFAAEVLKGALIAVSVAAAVGMAVSFFKAVKVTELLVKAIKLLNLSFLATPMGWVVLGITGIVVAFMALWKKSEAFRNFWMGVWGEIKRVASDVWGHIMDAARPIFDFFREIGDAAKGIWDILWKGDYTGMPFGIEEDSPLVGFLLDIRDLATGLWDLIWKGDYTGLPFGLDEDSGFVGFLLDARELVTGLWDLIWRGDYTGLPFGLEEDSGLVGFILGVREKIKLVGNAWEELTVAFRGGDWGYGALEQLIGTDRAEWAVNAIGSVKSAWGELVAAFNGKDWGYGALEQIIGSERAEWLVNAVGSVKAAWEELVKSVQGHDWGYGALAAIFGEDNGKAIADTAASIGQAVRDGFGLARDVAREVWETIQDLAPLLWDIAKSLGSAAWDAVVAVFSTVVEVGKALWDVLLSVEGAIWDLIQALAPVLLPVLKILGGLIGGALVVGIFAFLYGLRFLAGVIKVVAKVIAWLAEHILAPLIGVLADVVSWLVEHLGGAFSWLIEKIGEFITWGRETLPAFWDGIKDAWNSTIEWITGFWDGVKDAWSTSIDWLSGLFSGLWEGLQSAWESYGQPVVDFFVNAFLLGFGLVVLAVRALRDAWDWLWPHLQEAWDTYGQPVVDFVVQAFQWWWEGVKVVFGWLKDAWDALWSALQWAWDTIGAPVVDWIKNRFEDFWNGLQIIFGWVKDGWNFLWEAVRWVYDSIIAPVISWVKDRFEDMRAGVEIVSQKVRDAIGWMADKVRAFYDDYVAPMVQRVVDGFNRVKDTAVELKDKVVGAFRDAGSWLLDAGRHLVEGFINGITGMIGKAVDAAKDLGNKAISAAKETLGIHSPSRVFAQIGHDIGAGLVRGVDAMQSAVGDSAQALADSASSVSVAGPQVSVGAQVQAPDMSGVGASTMVASGAFSVMAQDMVVASQTVLDPMLVAQMEQFAALGVTAQAQAQGVVLPAWVGMAAGMQAVTAGTVQPMMGQVQAGMAATAGVIAAQAGGVVSPAWALMGANMAGVNTSVLQPVMGNVQGSMLATAGLVASQTGGVISPAWAAMGSHMMGVKVGTIDPVFAGIQGGLVTVTGAFGNAVGSITSQWSRIREATAAPVRFTVQSVFNDGLVGMWNSVSDLVGTQKMSPYPVRFATGGLVTGPGGPTDDRIPALLSNREYVMTGEAVKRIGVDNLNALNYSGVSVAPGAFRDRKQQKALLADATFTAVASRYAGGGIVQGSKAWNQLRRGMLWAQSLSGRPYVLGGDPVGGGGTDCSGYMSSIADKIQGGVGHRQWATMAFNGGGNSQYPSGPQGFIKGLKPGFSIGVTNGGAAGGHTAGTMGGVEGMPAVNVESGGSPSRVKFGTGAVGADHSYFRTHYHLPLGFDGGFVSGGGAGPSIAEIVAGMMKPLRDKARGAAVSWQNSHPGQVNTLPVAVEKVLGDAIQKKVEKLASEMSADPGGSGVERWAPMAKTALARAGFEPNERNVRLMLAQINTESSGNAGASQQIVDINGTGDAAGVGLLQIIPGTFAAYRDPSLPNDRRDPMANMTAALRYYKARYGMDLGRMWGQGHGYDLGGVMQGKGFFGKFTTEPERVLSPRQTASFDRLVEWLDRTPDPEIRRSDSGTVDSYGDTKVTRQVMVTQNIVTRDAKESADAVEDRLMKLML